MVVNQTLKDNFIRADESELAKALTDRDSPPATPRSSRRDSSGRLGRASGVLTVVTGSYDAYRAYHDAPDDGVSQALAVAESVARTGTTAAGGAIGATAAAGGCAATVVLALARSSEQRVGSPAASWGRTVRRRELGREARSEGGSTDERFVGVAT